MFMAAKDASALSIHVADSMITAPYSAAFGFL
jgi:hypothetical protein